MQFRPYFYGNPLMCTPRRQGQWKLWLSPRLHVIMPPWPMSTKLKISLSSDSEVGSQSLLNRLINSAELIYSSPYLQSILLRIKDTASWVGGSAHSAASPVLVIVNSQAYTAIALGVSAAQDQGNLHLCRWVGSKLDHERLQIASHNHTITIPA